MVLILHVLGGIIVGGSTGEGCDGYNDKAANRPHNYRAVSQDFDVNLRNTIQAPRYIIGKIEFIKALTANAPRVRPM